MPIQKLLLGLASCEHSRSCSKSQKVIECANNLPNAYPADLEDSLSDKLLQFSSFLSTDFAGKLLEASASPAISATTSVTIPVSEASSDESNSERTVSVAVVTKDHDNVLLGGYSMELRLYRLIVAKNLETVFSNIVIYFESI